MRWTPSQLINADRDQWLVMVSRLPSGEGAIDGDASGVAAVSVRWNDRLDGNPDNLLEFIGRSQL